jgi:hypothetical protein
MGFLNEPTECKRASLLSVGISFLIYVHCTLLHRPLVCSCAWGTLLLLLLALALALFPLAVPVSLLVDIFGDLLTTEPEDLDVGTHG